MAEPGTTDRAVIVRPTVGAFVAIAPAAMHFDGRLVHISTAAYPAAPSAQVLGRGGGELGLAAADGFVAKHHVLDGELLEQVTQGEFVTQAPDHDECDDVGRVLRRAQHVAAAFIELLATLAAAETAITWPVRSGRWVTTSDPHSEHRIPVRHIVDRLNTESGTCRPGMWHEY